MTTFNRREFLQASAASYLLHTIDLPAETKAPAEVVRAGKVIRAKGRDYTWEWSPENDEMRLLDQWGLLITRGKLQPAVLVQAEGEEVKRRCLAGRPDSHELRENTLVIHYTGVNGSGTLTATWRFDDDGFWLDPLVYESAHSEDVESLHYFAQGTGDAAQPDLQSNYFVLPVASETSALSPILVADFAGMGLDTTWWVGRGWTGGPGIVQAWGLPVHYFCGFHRAPYAYQLTPPVKLPAVPPEQLLNAFCCGLAELPGGDLFLEARKNRYSLIVSYRSDIWKHLHGPGKLTLGAKLYWTVGPNYYEAIRRYYLGLRKTGVIPKKTNSPRKNAVALAPSFCTAGEEYAHGGLQKGPDRFDEPLLNSMLADMKTSGFKAKLFLIDAKWEGKYGSLQHSPERFPHFPEFLARLRAEGRYVALWAAFMRCEDPAELGLTTAHMLRLPDGNPFIVGNGSDSDTEERFYIMDITQPEVQKVIRDLAKGFIRRYRPDFVKFDFGYELPSLAAAAPKDMNWAGERLLLKAMEVVVRALREENPDIVVLYYSLSPLFIEYFDLLSPDDLGYCLGDFDLEANQRFFFSSLLGEIGMPTWGSSGYEWTTAPEIWFDSAAIGTLGSLGSFYGPRPDMLATPARVAKYNGLTEVIREAETFSMIPVDAAIYGPARGAHMSSWARVENGEVVLVALRERRWDGRKGVGKFRDLVSCNTSAVVASKTPEGIARASRLAIVPYGDGELTLKREGSGSREAEVVEHYFRGGISKTRIPVQDARLRIPLRERSGDGSLVEWIEVNL